MKKELHELDKVVWGVLPIINYRNCYVTKQPNNLYSIWKHVNLLPHEIDEYIDNSLMAVSKSIKNE